MICNYGAVFICSSDLSLGRVGPSGFVFDGQSLLDVAQLFGALNAIVYNRARGSRELSFSVWRFFSTEADAIAFALTHEDTLALQDDLHIADDAETVSYTMASAAAQARIAQVDGVSVRAEYKFTGAKFTLDP